MPNNIQAKTPPRTLPSLPAGLLDLFDEKPKTAQEINDSAFAWRSRDGRDSTLSSHHLD